MDKVHELLRRGSSRLKSLRNGHDDLHKIISDLEHLKYTCDSFNEAQQVAWEDISRWAARERNVALGETFQQLYELSCIWKDVQRNIKKFKRLFKQILESELHLDKCRAQLKSCEQKIAELEEKGLNNRRDTGRELAVERDLKINLQAEIHEKGITNESMKLTNTKESLTNFSGAYMDTAEKMWTVFNAYYTVSKCLPEVQDNDLGSIRFTGSEYMAHTVNLTKANILSHKPFILRESAPPPPYGFVSSNSNSANEAPRYSNI